MLLSTLLVLLVVTGGTRAADAGGVVPYFNSSADGKPRGDAGLSMSSEHLHFAADVAMRNRDGDTVILPKLSSNVSLGRRVGLETRFDFAERNSRTSLLDAKFATRLHVKAPASFLDELEGKFWRSPGGQTGRLFKLGFYQRFGENRLEGPITIRSQATLETLSAGTLLLGQAPPGSRRLGFEAEVGTPIVGSNGQTALRLKLVRSSGMNPETARSLAYDRSWRLPSAAQLAFNVGMLHATRPASEVLEPSLGLRWRTEF